jgi:glycosyltransferase involved in cell wall biosynthesis
MRIFMLGWEFPPFIAGGLGTACYGLTRALDKLGQEVVFVLPQPVEGAEAEHIRLLSPATAGGAVAARSGAEGASERAGEGGRGGFEHTRFVGVPAVFSSPYPAFDESGGPVAAAPASAQTGGAGGRRVDVENLTSEDVAALTGLAGLSPPAPPHSQTGPEGRRSAGYEGDMIANTEQYARLVVRVGAAENFDVIHAHDWMTYPAGLALARITGKPLLAHIHSTEFDRSGEHVNQRVYDIERRGMMGATRVIAVSMLTKSICVRRYAIPAEKIDVVYNGIDSQAAQPAPDVRIEKRDKIVLFLGRITMQKGPEYFMAAAKRVLEKIKNVKLVVAGSGAMAIPMIEMAAQMGIGQRVLFTGFLRGEAVDRIFQMADCYVMPSVSEPFGIAPLEAMKNDTPVIISKQSGVSEVLTHALKVDFWDIDDMANKIVAVLTYPPLGQTLRQHGAFELRKLTWEGAAVKCVQSYGRAIAAAA